jgi:type I restriction enzyme S subunit
VTCEAFFEKFELLANAPDAVARMRELILEFAIRGKVVPQVVEEEPASELLKRLASARSDQRGRQELLDPVGDDAYLQLPSGWEWTRLGNTGRIFNGNSVSESGKVELAKVEVGLPFIATKDVGYGRTDLAYDNGLKVSVGDPRFKVARSNSVLICAEGGSAGRKIGIADRDICFGNKLFANEVHEGMHPRFLFYIYQSHTFFRQFTARMTGIIGGISRSEFISLPIPIPPENEQKRIVAKVDELMALCDRLEAQQRERETRQAELARASLARFTDASNPANLEYLFHPSYAISPADLRKSILTLAVQGKLVPQDPADEPADETLRRCEVELNRWAVAPDEERQAVPDSWTWIRFAGVGEQRLGKMLDAQKNRGELKPYLRNSNVQWMRFELDDVKEMRVEEREVEELRLKTGDLLICEGGEPGRCAIWREEIREMYFQKAIHRVRPCDAVLSEYLALNLQIDCANGVLAGYFTGTTIKHLTGRSLAAYPVPIPPLAEQRRIVDKVEQLMALVEALESQLTTSRATGEKLLAAIVAELTTGKDCYEAA